MTALELAAGSRTGHLADFNREAELYEPDVETLGR